MPITRTEFEDVFPKLVKDLIAHAKQYGVPENAVEWYRKVTPILLPRYLIYVDGVVQSLEHNTTGGKYNRGMSVVDTSSLLLGRPLNEKEHFQSATLGWCTELLQAFFLVSDDIMDSSITRRGSPCWYRMPEVGMIAINDAFMLESSIFTLLKKHFRQEACYLDLIELFHEVTLQTELGQLCDLLTAPEDNVNLSSFSLEKYTFIVIFKTAYYSFYLPVALSLHLLGLATPQNLAQAQRILIPLGEYFQVQDDFLDNYGSPETIGKIGTDIQDNKCSWLINQGLARATPAQRALLDAHYGRKDAAAEAEVKKVFAELKLDDVYRAYEEAKVGELRKLIAEVDESEGLKRSVFEGFLGKIYKRDR
ncbi:MAG: Farnesyl pyrophosphate synthetase [Thelocarpon impressellum]|nr:MAG: Farnesyl pyrophosphate synthetase [Thelocarpon impressellum]